MSSSPSPTFAEVTRHPSNHNRGIEKLIDDIDNSVVVAAHGIKLQVREPVGIIAEDIAVLIDGNCVFHIPSRLERRVSGIWKITLNFVILLQPYRYTIRIVFHGPNHH